jgi:hypothetical protein
MGKGELKLVVNARKGQAFFQEFVDIVPPMLWVMNYQISVDSVDPEVFKPVTAG